MGAYSIIQDTFEKEYNTRSDEYKNRLTTWGKENSVVRIERPTNISRAHELGYKAKQGVIVARVRIKKGKRKRQKADGGRKPSKNGRFFSRALSLQSISEKRASSKFANCEVLNSYYVGDVGSYKYFEVILLDKSSPVITKDKVYKGIVSQTGRAERGLTSVSKKSRNRKKV